MKKTVFFLSLICSMHLSAQTWKWGVGSSTPGAVNEAWPVAVDHSGNVYQVGSAFSFSMAVDSIKCIFGTDTVYAPHNLTIVSTDSNGAYRWAIGATSGNPQQISEIVMDANDNLYIFGNYETSLGAVTIGGVSITSTASWGCFCAKISPAGTVVWLKNIYDNPSSAFIGGGIDGAGNLYISGAFRDATLSIGSNTLINAGAAGTTDVFIARLDTLGNPTWARSIGGDSAETITGMSVAQNGDIAICGTYNSLSFSVGPDTLTFPAGGTIPYFFVAKFDSGAHALWARKMQPESSFAILNYIAQDVWGNEYLTGYYITNIMFGADSLPRVGSVRQFLAKYDQHGSFLWAKNTANYYNVVGWAIAPDECGNVWVAGGQPTSVAGDPMYLMKYDGSGTLLDSLILASGGDDQIGVVVDNKGNLYVSGDYVMDFAIGATTLHLGVSGETSFLARYSYPFCTLTPSLETANTINNAKSVMVYPNPASDELYIENGGIGTTAKLYNVMGQQLSATTISSDKQVINTASLAPGTYLLQLADGNGNRVNKTFVKE